MTPTLDHLFERRLLEQMLAERYVKASRHPELPLRILNYTSRAQFDGAWNEVTSICRGLIVDAHDQLVARPFPKFFTAEQRGGQLPGGPVQVTEKVDGSLGILYPNGGGYGVATRGSFTSGQAVHATDLWRRRYQDRADLQAGWTYLCEIIYPANRIVVDYQGLDDLVLLGAVDIATGCSVPLDDARTGWPGPVVDEHPYRSAAEALTAPERSNAEGFVIHFTEPDLRVKVKYGEYVRLHRLLTDVSERRIWEALSEGVDLHGWLDGVPDEFHSFVHTTRERMLTAYAALEDELRAHLLRITAALPAGYTRGQLAEAVNRLGGTYPLAKALYPLVDGKDYARIIWATLRPEEHLPIFSQRTDAE